MSISLKLDVLSITRYRTFFQSKSFLVVKWRVKGRGWKLFTTRFTLKLILLIVIIRENNGWVNLIETYFRPTLFTILVSFILRQQSNYYVLVTPFAPGVSSWSTPDPFFIPLYITWMQTGENGSLKMKIALFKSNFLCTEYLRCQVILKRLKIVSWVVEISETLNNRECERQVSFRANISR